MPLSKPFTDLQYEPDFSFPSDLHLPLDPVLSLCDGNTQAERNGIAAIWICYVQPHRTSVPPQLYAGGNFAESGSAAVLTGYVVFPVL